MPQKRAERLERFLAYAFAGADLLFSIDEAGRLSEMLGAVRALVGADDDTLLGQPWTQLLVSEDRDLAAALLLSLNAGKRKGPIRVRLAGHGSVQQVGLTLFQGAGDCGTVGTLSLSSSVDLPRPPASGALLAAEELYADLPALLAQAQSAGLGLSLGFVQTHGLSDAAAAAPPELRRRLEDSVFACLKAGSLRGASAVKLEGDRFAVLSEAPDEALTDRLLRAVEGFAPAVTFSYAAAPISLEHSSDEAARAIKIAMESFIGRDPAEAATSLNAAVRETVARAHTLKASIVARRFKLEYQPIVRLKDRQVHHYEALLRLNDRTNPFEAIRLAEELGVMLAFDQAIAETAIADLAMHEDPDLHVAINVSAASLLSEAYGQGLIAQLKSSGVSPKRLLVELIETKPIDDYDLAQARINALRKAGIRFCIDDVGAGSAAFDHLRLLSFDFLKLDGRFAHELLSSIRGQVVVRHLAQLGRELGGAAIAEHVETEGEADIFKASGVELGQGWLFGRPGSLPAPAPPIRAARRMGAREDWR